MVTSGAPAHRSPLRTITTWAVVAIFSLGSVIAVSASWALGATVLELYDARSGLRSRATGPDYGNSQMLAIAESVGLSPAEGADRILLLTISSDTPWRELMSVWSRALQESGGAAGTELLVAATQDVPVDQLESSLAASGLRSQFKRLQDFPGFARSTGLRWMPTQMLMSRTGEILAVAEGIPTSTDDLRPLLVATKTPPVTPRLVRLGGMKAVVAR